MTSVPIDAPSINSISEQIKQANLDGKTLQIAGNKSKLNLGEFFSSVEEKTTEQLCLSRYSGIIDYSPSEMVVTVKAGTTLAELNAVLAEKNQMLAFEPPDYGNSTIGGTYASALTGPSKPFRGVLRDYILGTKIVDGRGQVLSFGGRMIKNVAGYDVSRLLAGSKGSMAAITEISIKVVPLVNELTYRVATQQADAIKLMNELAATSLPLSACAYVNGNAYFRLVESAGQHDLEKLSSGGQKAELVDNSIWHQLNPFQLATVDKSALWRVDVDSTHREIANTIAVDICGNRRWVVSNEKPNTPFATLWKNGPLAKRSESPARKKLVQGLRQVFDPNRVFLEPLEQNTINLGSVN